MEKLNLCLEDIFSREKCKVVIQKEMKELKDIQIIGTNRVYY